MNYSAELGENQTLVILVCPDTTVLTFDIKAPRSVRITFIAGGDTARVDEVAGDTPITWITEGFTSRTDAEAMAALYAAIRDLPISRVDVTS